MIWDNNEDIRVEHCDGSRRGIQQVLDACREERRPYVVIKDNCSAQQSCCSEGTSWASSTSQASRTSWASRTPELLNT